MLAFPLSYLNSGINFWSASFRRISNWIYVTSTLSTKVCHLVNEGFRMGNNMPSWWWQASISGVFKRCVSFWEKVWCLVYFPPGAPIKNHGQEVTSRFSFFITCFCSIKKTGSLYWKTIKLEKNTTAGQYEMFFQRIHYQTFLSANYIRLLLHL